MSFLQYKIPNEFKAKRSEAKKKKNNNRTKCVHSNWSFDDFMGAKHDII